MTRGSDQDTERERDGDWTGENEGKVKAVGVQTKETDKVRRVRRVRGERFVGKRLEGIRLGKARGLRRWGQGWLRLGVKMRCGSVLRVGNVANARCWGINPLSLEHEGRTQLYRCVRSFGIIGGKCRSIFCRLDCFFLGGGELGESVEKGRQGGQT